MADNKEKRKVEIILNAQQANASIKDMAAGVALMNNQLAKMAQDDPRREQLKKDFQELKERVKAARDEINGIASAEERQRQETERLTLAAQQLQQANTRTIAQGQEQTASYRQMKDAAGLLDKQLEEMGADDPGRQRLIDDLHTLKTRMAEAKAGFAASTQAAEELRQRELELAEATKKQAEEQAEANKQLVVNGQRANASFNEMKAAATQLEKQLHELSADDPGRAAMIKDFQQLQQRMAAARATLNTYVLTEEEARLAAEKLNSENQQVILNGQKVGATFNDMKASAALLEKQLHEMSSDDPGRKKMLADYHALQNRIEGVVQEMKGANHEAGFFKQAMGNAFAFAAGGGIEAAAEKVLDLGRDIAESTAKFETYETVMTNALGDKSKAQKAMADIQAMAAKTPFSVDELTGSFIKFVNRGLNPSMAEMTKMADLAASQGKSFDQLTEAVLDAGGGEFERLKEFGVKASKSGDQVSLSFKGVNQTVKNTPEAINGAIMAFGGMQGVAGATAAISKTLEGQWSNLGDTAGQLEVTVGKGLRPIFTWLLTMFGSLLNWVGRFIEGAAPLKSFFLEIIDVFADLYHDIGEVLESLGLFSDKTDTVKVALEALKFILMVLLIPVKTMALAARGIVDTFIDWYNKSEMLRGILGGLGAVVASAFRSIRDDAVKFLGGVGDILVGIFTLDKDKIIAGFKSALSATADVALAAGNRAANQFSAGYLANKDNHIEHKVRVKTGLEKEEDVTPAGEKLTSDGSADDAAAKKAEAAAKKAKAERDRRDREHLADLKQWVKDQGDILEGASELERARQEAANTDELKRREAQRHKILQDADHKYRELELLDGDHTIQMQQLLEERDLKLRELQTKWDEDDKKKKEQDLKDRLTTAETQTTDAITALENAHTLGLVSEQDYQDQLYFLQKQGLEKRLALLVEAGQGETKEAAAIRASLSKAEGDHVKKKKDQEEDLAKFNNKMAAQATGLLAQGLRQVEDMLDQKSAAYEAFKAARKAAELAELGINLAAEIQAIWKAASENPLNGITAGAAGTTQGVIQTGLAVARAAAAGAKIAGFAEGGPTGGGMVLPAGGVWDVMGQATGLGVSTGGKLLDAQGLEVAGIVHKNEYVIPEWMRADPQVLQVENWLELRRQRGYYQGGPTSADRSYPAAGEVGQADDMPASTNQQLVQVLASLDQRLQGVEKWATELEVVQDVLGLDRDLDRVKKLKGKGGIFG